VDTAEDGTVPGPDPSGAGSEHAKQQASVV